jgi:homoserine O-succinyltransferase/O-acetyltransferase
MPLFLDAVRSGTVSALNAANGLTIGLVNNMPDPAVEATERQFVELIRAASPDAVVQLKLFAIPEMPRTEATRHEMSERYHDIAALWDTPLDGLIVTGTEPRAKKLKDEPYWQAMARLVDWARENTGSTVWSCLAAHAAVLHADGIERKPLRDKLSGIFDCQLAADHPMTHDVTSPFTVPHSRYNDLPERPLQTAGYKVLSRSNSTDVDIFAKQDGSFFLFMQGHPEYDADTLLREYRRDIARFLAGERDRYPDMPLNYFNDTAVAAAEAFRARALTDRRSTLMADFPKTVLAVGLGNPWRRSAVGIYAKWTAYLRARKAERRPRGVPFRRTWRDWPLGVTRPAEGTAR